MTPTDSTNDQNLSYVSKKKLETTLSSVLY